MVTGLLIACLDGVRTLRCTWCTINNMAYGVVNPSIPDTYGEFPGPVAPTPHKALFLTSRDRLQRVLVVSRSSWWLVFHLQASSRSSLPAWPHPLFEGLVSRARSVFDLRFSPLHLGARREFCFCLYADACIH
jgi:hypothetical protein